MKKIYEPMKAEIVDLFDDVIRTSGLPSTGEDEMPIVPFKDELKTV